MRWEPVQVKRWMNEWLKGGKEKRRRAITQMHVCVWTRPLAHSLFFFSVSPLSPSTSNHNMMRMFYYEQPSIQLIGFREKRTIQLEGEMVDESKCANWMHKSKEEERETTSTSISKWVQLMFWKFNFLETPWKLVCVCSGPISFLPPIHPNQRKHDKNF